MVVPELILILAITVVLPLAILKMGLGYKRQQLEARRAEATQGGLTVGELKHLIREVVEEANTPLVERLDALEHRFSGEYADPRYQEIEEGRTIGRPVSSRPVR